MLQPLPRLSAFARRLLGRQPLPAPAPVPAEPGPEALMQSSLRELRMSTLARLACLMQAHSIAAGCLSAQGDHEQAALWEADTERLMEALQLVGRVECPSCNVVEVIAPESEAEYAALHRMLQQAAVSVTRAQLLDALEAGALEFSAPR